MEVEPTLYLHDGTGVKGRIQVRATHWWGNLWCVLPWTYPHIHVCDPAWVNETLWGKNLNWDFDFIMYCKAYSKDENYTSLTSTEFTVPKIYVRSKVAWHWQNSSSSLRRRAYRLLKLWLIFFIVNFACKFKTPYSIHSNQVYVKTHTPKTDL